MYVSPYRKPFLPLFTLSSVLCGSLPYRVRLSAYGCSLLRQFSDQARASRVARCVASPVYLAGPFPTGVRCMCGSRTLPRFRLLVQGTRARARPTAEKPVTARNLLEPSFWTMTAMSYLLQPFSGNLNDSVDLAPMTGVSLVRKLVILPSVTCAP
jgi:hypothetical protein